MPASITIVCPECDKEMKAPADVAGKKIRCKGCGAMFVACADDDLEELDDIVEVLDEDAYRGRLDAVVTNVDPSFSDELGDGTVRVLGVGTCGPDVPGRRTYHLAWTAAVGAGGLVSCPPVPARSIAERKSGGLRRRSIRTEIHKILIADSVRTTTDCCILQT